MAGSRSLRGAGVPQGRGISASVGTAILSGPSLRARSQDLHGIGKVIAGVISDFVSEGSSPKFDTVRGSYPEPFRRARSGSEKDQIAVCRVLVWTVSTRWSRRRAATPCARYRGSGREARHRSSVVSPGRGAVESTECMAKTPLRGPRISRAKGIGRVA